MIKQKYAFTLVELIVVITILAILWTIAFISLQWYPLSSRDSVRISDMSSMKTSLELFHLDSGKYPNTTNWTIITYSGGLTAWTQWLFWDDTFSNVENLDQVPTDPLTDKNYVYSITNNKQEYELAWIFEWDDIVLNNSIVSNTHAVLKTASAYITWEYNWKILKVVDGTNIYILAVPTIISWDITVDSIEQLVTQWKLISHWYANLPSNYRDSWYDADAWGTLTLVNDWVYEVFSWSLADLKIEANQIDLITNLQTAYNSTDLVNTYEIAEILSYDTVADTDWTKFLAQVLINENIDSSVEISKVVPAEPIVTVFGSAVQDTQYQTSSSGNWTVDTLLFVSTDRDAGTITYNGQMNAYWSGTLPIGSVSVYLYKWNGSSWDYQTYTTESINAWRVYNISGTHPFSAGIYKASYSSIGLFFEIAESGEISNASVKNTSTELEVETVTVTNVN